MVQLATLSKKRTTTFGLLRRAAHWLATAKVVEPDPQKRADEPLRKAAAGMLPRIKRAAKDAGLGLTARISRRDPQLIISSVRTPHNLNDGRSVDVALSIKVGLSKRKPRHVKYIIGGVVNPGDGTSEPQFVRLADLHQDTAYDPRVALRHFMNSAKNPRNLAS